jgi:hypothetical protein
MYPHERSLVERYQNRPFAFLGVNSDEDRTALKAVMAQEHLPWRCWCEGGTAGPIATRYRVRGWPTIYVLDANGVIRYSQVRGADLDTAVETLVREAESYLPPVTATLSKTTK